MVVGMQSHNIVHDSKVTLRYNAPDLLVPTF